MKQIKYSVAELTVAYKRKNHPHVDQKIDSPGDALNYIIEGFDKKTIEVQEQFVVLYLNAAGCVLGLYRASKGGITGTVADIRIILSIALKIVATAIVVAHNHPSGNLKPSRNDDELTKKLKEAAKTMDIKLLDHLIISPGGNYFSFADEGLL